MLKASLHFHPFYRIYSQDLVVIIVWLRRQRTSIIISTSSSSSSREKAFARKLSLPSWGVLSIRLVLVVSLDVDTRCTVARRKYRQKRGCQLKRNNPQADTVSFRIIRPKWSTVFWRMDLSYVPSILVSLNDDNEFNKLCAKFVQRFCHDRCYRFNVHRGWRLANFFFFARDDTPVISHRFCTKFFGENILCSG